MTDNAERKVRQWAQKRNGDPLTPHDVVDLVLAVDADSDKRHEETLELLGRHQLEADKRDERIADLEKQWHDATLTCRDRMEQIASELHEKTHNDHMDRYHGQVQETRRASDAPDADFTERRMAVFPESFSEMTVGWKLGKWLLMIIIIGVIGWLLPYWADSCAASNYEKISEPEPATHVLETPAP